MPESFERPSCPFFSLQMGPGLGSLERGIEEEEGEKGKAVTVRSGGGGGWDQDWGPQKQEGGCQRCLPPGLWERKALASGIFLFLLRAGVAGGKEEDGSWLSATAAGHARRSRA